MSTSGTGAPAPRAARRGRERQPEGLVQRGWRAEMLTGSDAWAAGSCVGQAATRAALTQHTGEPPAKAGFEKMLIGQLAASACPSRPSYTGAGKAPTPGPPRLGQYREALRRPGTDCHHLAVGLGAT